MGLKEVTLKVVAVRFEMKAFVVVVFPKTPFETKMLDPVAPFQVTRFRLAVPVTVRFVRASFTPVAFLYTTSTRFVLPVAVRFEVTRPP